MPMRVVVAPDKFAGSLTAAEAARAVAAGLLAARPDLEVIERPVADGGDGTLAAAVSAGFRLVAVTAEGPAGPPVATAFAAGDGTAVIELADVAGYRRLAAGHRAPLTTSTYGVGQLIAAALDTGARRIILGLGGSVSTDGGSGMLAALGLRLTGAGGVPVARGGAGLAGLTAVDASGLDARIGGTEFLIASDVDNPLLGPSGAACVFGPQKGASAAEVAILEQAMTRWAEVTNAVTGRDVSGVPGAGAAGGTGFGALAYLGASIRPGIEVVLDLIGFDAVLDGTSLVITGEGRIDEQTLRGKAPLGVARAAARRGVPAVAVAGQLSLSAAQAAAAGFRASYALTSLEPDLAACLARAAALLEQVGRDIASALPIARR